MVRVKTEQEHDVQILAGITHQALAAGELPTRLKLLNWGENPTSKGPVVVDEQTLSAIEAQRAGEAYKRLLIDFEHQSVEGSPHFRPSPRRHVGYGDIVCLKDDGVYLDNIGYTPAGTEFAREYADISPTVGFFKDSRVVSQVRSVALCPNGAVHDLTFLSAERQAEAKASNQETLMPDEAEFKKLLEQIGALNEALASLTADLKAVKDENAFLRQANDELSRKLVDTSATLQADSARALQAVETLERQTLLDKATAAGKVLQLSAEALAAVGLPELREMVARAKPGVVPMQARTPARVQDGVDAPRHTEISRMCGVQTKEEVKS